MKLSVVIWAGLCSRVVCEWFIIYRRRLYLCVASSLELVPVVTEILTQYKNVEKWAKPEKPAFDLSWTPLRPVTIKEPKGTVLIITPFNYPVWLTLCPLVSKNLTIFCPLTTKVLDRLELSQRDAQYLSSPPNNRLRLVVLWSNYSTSIWTLTW